MAQTQKIRIRLKAYDHEVLDRSARERAERDPGGPGLEREGEPGVIVDPALGEHRDPPARASSWPDAASTASRIDSKSSLRRFIRDRSRLSGSRSNREQHPPGWPAGSTQQTRS